MGFHTLTVSAAAERTGKSNFTLEQAFQACEPVPGELFRSDSRSDSRSDCAKIENHRVVCETVLRYLTRQHLFEHRTRHVVLKERRDELLQSLTSTMGSRLLSTAFSQHGTEIEVKDEIRLKFESNEKKDEKVV